MEKELIAGTRSAAFLADEILGRHDISRKDLSRDQRVIIAAAEVIAAQIFACNQTHESMSDKAKAERQFAKGSAFYADGKYKKAAKWWRKAADQGHVDARFNLGGMYFNGRGVDQSYPEAVKWYRKAADQGHSSAQYALRNMEAKEAYK